MVITQVPLSCLACATAQLLYSLCIHLFKMGLLFIVPGPKLGVGLHEMLTAH